MGFACCSSCGCRVVVVAVDVCMRDAVVALVATAAAVSTAAAVVVVAAVVTVVVAGCC